MAANEQIELEDVSLRSAEETKGEDSASDLDSDLSSDDEEFDPYSAAEKVLRETPILQPEQVDKYQGRQFVKRLLEISAIRPEDNEDDEDAEPYYWEDDNTAMTTAPTTKIWHNTHWAGAQVWGALEFVGEVVSHFFGLNQSRYQWALDELDRQRERRRQRAIERKQRKQMRQEALEKRQREKMEAENTTQAEA